MRSLRRPRGRVTLGIGVRDDVLGIVVLCGRVGLLGLFVRVVVGVRLRGLIVRVVVRRFGVDDRHLFDIVVCGVRFIVGGVFGVQIDDLDVDGIACGGILDVDAGVGVAIVVVNTTARRFRLFGIAHRAGPF